MKKESGRITAFFQKYLPEVELAYNLLGASTTVFALLTAIIIIMDTTQPQNVRSSLIGFSVGLTIINLVLFGLTLLPYWLATGQVRQQQRELKQMQREQRRARKSAKQN